MGDQTLCSAFSPGKRPEEVASQVESAMIPHSSRWQVFCDWRYGSYHPCVHVYAWSPNSPGGTHRTHGELADCDRGHYFQSVQEQTCLLLHGRTVWGLRGREGRMGKGRTGFKVSYLRWNRLKQQSVLPVQPGLFCGKKFHHDSPFTFYDLPGQNHDNSVWKHWWKVCQGFLSNTQTGSTAPLLHQLAQTGSTHPFIAA